MLEFKRMNVKFDQIKIQSSLDYPIMSFVQIQDSKWNPSSQTNHMLQKCIISSKLQSST